MATQLTQRNREVAYEMFAAGADSEKVARRIRRPVGTVRALRANWTRSHVSTPSTNVASASSSNVTDGETVVITLNSNRLRTALAEGKSVQLVIKAS